MRDVTYRTSTADRLTVPVAEVAAKSVPAPRQIAAPTGFVFRENRLYARTRRVLDVVGVALVSAAAVPIMLVAALAILI